MKKSKLIEWVKIEDLSIFFSQKPRIVLREPSEVQNPFEILSIEQYPFRNLEPFICAIFDHKNFKKYRFVVQKQNYDGASIPKLLWFLVGANTNPFYKIPSLIHDVICNEHKLVNYDRKLSSRVFRALLLREGVSKIKANIMFYAVDLYQKFIVKW